jgi:replicative DNA helicase
MSERPPSRDFELYLILAIIHDNRFRDYVSEHIRPEIFTEFDCQHLYETIVRMRSKKKAITFFSVFETVRRDTKLSDERAAEICEELKPYIGVDADRSPLDSVVDGVLPIVEDMVKKRLVEMAIVKSTDLYEAEKPDDIIELWGKVGQQAIYRVPDKLSVWDTLRDFKGDMRKAIGYQIGVPTGICGLDKSMHMERLDDVLFYKGAGRGHLGILLGDSNLGKTTFALNLGLFCSLSGFNVEYYSMEMDKEYLMVRSASILTGIPTMEIIENNVQKKTKKLTAEIEEKYPKRGRFELHYSTPENLSLSTIAHDLTMNARQGFKTDVLIVDYIDLLRSERQYRERRHEIGANTIGLRSLAAEFGCTAFTPSQMNRGVFQDKKRAKDRRNMSEDFSKVFTCDYLWNLTERIEVVTPIGKRPEERLIVDCFVDKNRFGRRGMTFSLLPDKETGRFYDIFPRRIGG